MKKIIAILALIAIVAFGAFATSVVSAGAGGYGVFESGLYSIGPAVKIFTTSGNTFNDFTVESPMWIRNIKSFDDVSNFIANVDIKDSDLKFLQIVRGTETFGLALNFLGEEGPLNLTLGVGGSVAMDALFIDANNRIMEFRAGAGAVLDFGITIARPLTVVVGVSADYPVFGLRVITDNGSTTTDTYTVDKSHVIAAAHVGVGLSF